MSCEKCEENQEKGMVAWYRLGIANIGILGCNNHVKEAIDALNEYQSKKESK